MSKEEKKKFDNLSNAIISVISKIGENEDVLSIIVNNDSRPFEKKLSDLQKNNATNPIHRDAKILPYPFNPDTKIQESSTIRAFFPTGKFDNGKPQSVWLNTDLIVDIIVAKNLWLMIDEDNKDVVRPYRLMSEIAHDLTDRNMSKESDLFKTVGPLSLSGFDHLSINAEYEAIRLSFSFDSIEYIPQR